MVLQRQDKKEEKQNDHIKQQQRKIEFGDFFGYAIFEDKVS